MCASHLSPYRKRIRRILVSFLFPMVVSLSSPIGISEAQDGEDPEGRFPYCAINVQSPGTIRESSLPVRVGALSLNRYLLHAKAVISRVRGLQESQHDSESVSEPCRIADLPGMNISATRRLISRTVDVRCVMMKRGPPSQGSFPIPFTSYSGSPHSSSPHNISAHSSACFLWFSMDEIGLANRVNLRKE